MPALLRPLVRTEGGLWIRQWQKAAGEIEGYGIGWRQILGPDDFIVAATFDVSSPEIVKVSSSWTRTMSVWWCSGGVPNGVYDIVHHITSDTGRELEQTMRLHIFKK